MKMFSIEQRGSIAVVLQSMQHEKKSPWNSRRISCVNRTASKNIQKSGKFLNYRFSTGKGKVLPRTGHKGPEGE
jgi:hypothetical protein